MVSKNKEHVPLKVAAGPSALTDLSEQLDTRREQFKDTLQTRL